MAERAADQQREAGDARLVALERALPPALAAPPAKMASLLWELTSLLAEGGAHPGSGAGHARHWFRARGGLGLVDRLAATVCAASGQQLGRYFKAISRVFVSLLMVCLSSAGRA